MLDCNDEFQPVEHLRKLKELDFEKVMEVFLSETFNDLHPLSLYCLKLKNDILNSLEELQFIFGLPRITPDLRIESPTSVETSIRFTSGYYYQYLPALDILDPSQLPNTRMFSVFSPLDSSYHVHAIFDSAPGADYGYEGCEFAADMFKNLSSLNLANFPGVINETLNLINIELLARRKGEGKNCSINAIIAIIKENGNVIIKVGDSSTFLVSVTGLEFKNLALKPTLYLGDFNGCVEPEIIPFNLTKTDLLIISNSTFIGSDFTDPNMFVDLIRERAHSFRYGFFGLGKALDKSKQNHESAAIFVQSFL